MNTWYQDYFLQQNSAFTVTLRCFAVPFATSRHPFQTPSEWIYDRIQ
ncbi:MAG: hypothetical protein VKJ46_03620 [Leptolyngbyaceae bacterium]|nr:hypothetical protein [Leptolyngbyaceae bacterium]